MKVAFLHPDFGIGGAERLVLDAAIAFDEAGHEVSIVTNQFSESHCFSDALQFKERIYVCAKWFPRTVFGKFYAICAYLRICIAALYVISRQEADLIFIDQVSLPLLLFRLASPFYKPQLVFYCHFPDQLLAAHDRPIKRIYRLVIDSIENWTIGLADKIYVNSEFTKNTCLKTFSIPAERLDVLYPSVKTENLDKASEKNEDSGVPSKFQYVFLSLNRFENKKNHGLALNVFAQLKKTISDDEFSKCAMVFAGGYDKLNEENEQVYIGLKSKASDLSLTENVLFFASPSDAQKVALLKRASLVFYTPEREHFGIVPVEAMYLETPVLALRSGGPIETIADNETGFLIDDLGNIQAYTNKFVDIIRQEGLSERLGKNGHKRVLEKFSFGAFTKQLLETCMG